MDGAAVFKPDSILHYALASNSQLRTHTVAVWPDTEECFPPRFALSARPPRHRARAREPFPDRTTNTRRTASARNQHRPERRRTRAEQRPSPSNHVSKHQIQMVTGSPNSNLAKWDAALIVFSPPSDRHFACVAPCSVSCPMHQQIAPSDGSTYLRLLAF